jgi:outer membrane protein assembly factor BamD
MKHRFEVYFTSFIIIVITVLFTAGCSKRGAELNLTAEERFQLGMGHYENEKYMRAIDEFMLVTRQHSGSDYADDAQFYKGMSYFHREEFILAANEFEILISTMGGSQYIPDAQYYLALSYYELSPRYDLDQQYTVKAIDELQTFLDYFPIHEKAPGADDMIRELNEKLARKEYENARLYTKMRYLRAATRYFEIVAERYHDSRYAELAYLGKAEVLIERRMYDEANEVLQRFLDTYPDSAHRGRVLALERRISDELTGGDAGEQTSGEEETQ